MVIPEKEDRVLVTLDGLKVRLRPISLLMVERIQEAVRREWLARGEKVDPPTYAIPTLGGGEERHPVTATVLDKDPDLAREHGEAWTIHLEALARMSAEADDRVGRYVLLEGVVMPDEFAGEEWVRSQRRWGVEPPEDPEERAYHYLMTEVFRTPPDAHEVGMRIMALSSGGVVEEERIQAALRLFRDSLRRSVGDAFGGSGAAAGQVAPQPDVHTGPDGAPLGDGSEPAPGSQQG